MRSESQAAFHEAGRAVAAIKLLNGVVQADVEQGTSYHGVEATGHVELVLFDLNEENVLRYLVVVMSGWIADNRTGEQGPKVLADYACMLTVAHKVGWNTDRFNSACGVAYGVADAFVAANWQHIKVVAQQLLENKTLSGDTIKQLIS
jgi:hypothetical protein